MGSIRRRKNKEYYAVFKGRVDEPTIFSSWGDAHPRVTGCPAIHEAFFTIEEAREYMMRKGVSLCKEVIKDTAQDTTPERDKPVFYAIAHGKNPGIRRGYYGETGALEEIHEISGACHKRFKTEAQAEAFIEDWKQSYADVWHREVKNALDGGFRPRNMELSIRGILHDGNDNTSISAERDCASCMLPLISVLRTPDCAVSAAEWTTTGFFSVPMKKVNRSD